jgi:1,4-dihydroxy-2-naphthoyl-CoA synthase
MIFEAGLVGDFFLTDDIKEGSGAFIEKRPPAFRRK